MKISNLCLTFVFIALLACKKDKETQPNNDCRISKIMRETGEIEADFIYNSKKQLVTACYPTSGSMEKPGSTLSLTYDANGKINLGRQTYNDPMIAASLYTFNSEGLVTQIKGEDLNSYTLSTYEYNAQKQVSKAELFSKLSAASPLKHIATHSYEYRNNNIEKVNSAVYVRGSSQTDTVYSTTIYEYNTSKNPFYEFRFFNPSESNSSVNNQVKSTITRTNPDGTVTGSDQILFSYQFNEIEQPTQVIQSFGNSASDPLVIKYDYSCK